MCDAGCVGRLLLLFVLVPAIELALLLELGRHIGTLATLGLIAATGLLGAFLARRQGLGVLRKIRLEAEEGRIPAGPIADGVMILLAAALLVTPGILTDAVGFLCLIPSTRRAIRRRIWDHLVEAVRSGRVRVSVSARGRVVRREDLPHRAPRPGAPDRED